MTPEDFNGNQQTVIPVQAEEFRNQRVVVMGLGRFGGGIGVTRWLIDQGARVTVTDLADRNTLEESVARLWE